MMNENTNGREIKRIRPEYVLPTYIPFCPIHNCRMYSNKTKGQSKLFVCQFKECSFTDYVPVARYVQEGTLLSEFRRMGKDAESP